MGALELQRLMTSAMASKILKEQKGFTLIELLVVVVVIAVLSGLVLSILNSVGIRGKSWDSRRISDLREIQTALALYYSDFRAYPDTGNSWIRVTGVDAMSSVLEPSYMNKVPVDPKLSGADTDPCSNIGNYRYNYRSDGTYYTLSAIMEVVSTNDSHQCVDLNNWGGCSGTPETSDYCYGVENPQ